jgi:hypothetical protein
MMEDDLDGLTNASPSQIDLPMTTNERITPDEHWTAKNVR